MNKARLFAVVAFAFSISVLSAEERQDLKEMEQLLGLVSTYLKAAASGDSTEMQQFWDPDLPRKPAFSEEKHMSAGKPARDRSPGVRILTHG